MHRQLAHATEGYEEGSSTNSTNHEEAGDEGHEEGSSTSSTNHEEVGDEGHEGGSRTSSTNLEEVGDEGHVVWWSNNRQVTNDGGAE